MDSINIAADTVERGFTLLPSTTLHSRLHALWIRLISPHPSLSPDENKHARLMLALLVGALALAYVGGPLAILIELMDQGVREADLLFVVAIAAAVALIYFLARSPRWKAASLLFVYTPTALLAVVSLLQDPADASTFWVYFMLLGAVLASLLLTPRQTVTVAATNVLVILGLVVVLPQWTLNGLFDELLLNTAIPMLLLISVNIRRQYEAQIQRQMAELADAEAEARAARQQAERANQVKSAFLASVSHELRTPLNAIINFSEFLERELLGPTNEKQQATLREIVGSGEHLLSLINDVLDISKIESGSLRLFVEDGIDVAEILNAALVTSRSLLGDKPVTLSADVPGELPRIRGDRQRILQILLNILSNACKFTSKGEIVVSASTAGDELRIAVRDTGPGIPDAERDAVFESFRQTRVGIRQGSGTGLGMAISKSLAEAHGGRLWFESTMGQGTTFTMSLPVRSETLEPAR